MLQFWFFYAAAIKFLRKSAPPVQLVLKVLRVKQILRVWQAKQVRQNCLKTLADFTGEPVFVEALDKAVSAFYRYSR